MLVNVRYLQPISLELGVSEEIVTLRPTASVAELMAAIASRHGKRPPGSLAMSKNGSFKNSAIVLALQREGLTGSKRIDYTKAEGVQLQDNDVALLYLISCG